MRDAHYLFWIRHPAVGFGLSALFGVSNIFLSLLWIFYQCLLFRRKAIAVVLSTLGFMLYTHQLFSNLPETTTGQFRFQVHSLQRFDSPFHKGWLYKGTVAGSIPCSVFYYGEQRPKANRYYLLTGTLKKKGFLQYTVKVKQWTPIEWSWSLAELRFAVKGKFRSLLQKHLQKKSASFLTALFTGDKEDRALTFEFARLGLQHILAISGFHFAILIAIFSFAVRHIFASKNRIWSLLTLALIYFLFVGDSPPVFRTFITLAFFFGGELMSRRSSGLNLLGASLFLELLLNPFDFYTIGFQLSFLSCFGILLFHRPLEKVLNPLLPSRTFEELKRLSFSAQWGAIMLAFIKKSLQIMLAVNLALLPVLLFHFHRFPLLSFIYNLFVPELVSLSLLLLLISLALHLAFPLFGLLAFTITDFFTSELLQLIAYPPVLLDYALLGMPPLWLVILYLTGLLFGGIHLCPKSDLCENGGPWRS